MNVVLESVDTSQTRRDVEVVERKGLGHPDTICDALAERFSVTLSRCYMERFGAILHHNVDKALLRGGTARATFGGGEVQEPIEIYLAGRAVTQAGGATIPVEDIAVSCAKEWIRDNLHAVDPERHIRVKCLVRPGSVDLSNLFARPSARSVPLSNDTSVGVGYAPLTPVERVVLELERRLNARSLIARRPAHGEDVKIMAVRHRSDVSLTVARAFVAAHVASLEAYREELRAVETCAREVAESLGLAPRVQVNAADAPDGSSVYLTVTGTSAECGDDGQVGRGNRANGLISPGNPMSLEALAGKNPTTHVGKLYNIVARDAAESIVSHVPGVERAECCLVSRIGAPIDEPAFAHIRVAGSSLSPRASSTVEEIVRTHVGGITRISDRLLAESVRLF